MDALRVLGADVRPVPAVPFDNPENYNHQVQCVCVWGVGGCGRVCVCVCVGVWV